MWNPGGNNTHAHGNNEEEPQAQLTLAASALAAYADADANARAFATVDPYTQAGDVGYPYRHVPHPHPHPQHHAAYHHSVQQQQGYYAEDSYHHPQQQPQPHPLHQQQQQQQQQQHHPQQMSPALHDSDDDDESSVEIAHVQAPVVAMPVASDDDDDDDSDVARPVPTATTTTSTATATATASNPTAASAKKQTPKKAAPKKKAPAAKRKTPTKTNKASPKRTSPAAKSNKSSLAWPKWALTLDDAIPDMTPQEYTNLQQLMVQFCRVPLLAEFSRPIALLHPELMPVYSKVVKRPQDLGQVCRAIRRREYKNARQVKLDVWRIFSNCIKYHTHPSNKDGAVPSFVSISLHLREYFNALWQEYMLPSSISSSLNHSSSTSNTNKDRHGQWIKRAVEQRTTDRKKRFSAASATALSAKCMTKLHTALDKFLNLYGRADDLDKEPLVPLNDELECEDPALAHDFAIFCQNIHGLKVQLANKIANNKECTMEEIKEDTQKCFADCFMDRPEYQTRIQQRLDRVLGKAVVPIYEINNRGVNQSSVWGCMAAAIWARESSKKPYWPALVLGILAPDVQKEDWHALLTECNEARLPERLRAELQAGKKRAEQALKRQSTGTTDQMMSYFLVEFMGTHEFIWVKEADIIESFDPEDDPNVSIAHGNVTKKKRSSRGSQTPASAKLLADAIEEGRWALEEFELQLNDTCGDLPDEEDEDADEEMNYSYSVLCQSDDEAEEATDEKINATTDEKTNALSLSDSEELHELLATDGMIDFTQEGRKNAKKRAAALKKQKADAKKETLKKQKEEHAKKVKLNKAKKAQEELKKKKKEPSAKSKSSRGKTSEQKKLDQKREKEEKRELRELERRRQKRGKERERVLQQLEDDPNVTTKKRKSSSDKSSGKRRKRNDIPDKRGRAYDTVQGYLTRIAKNHEEENKSLALGGVIALPAASVESSGLLGMAIAIRAAAGEIDMPDDGSLQKPWDAIDTNNPTTSEERCQNLKTQLGMLEEALAKLVSHEKWRSEFIDHALKRKEAHEGDLFRRAKEARKSPIKMKKNWRKSTSPSKKSAKKEGLDEDDTKITEKEDGANRDDNEKEDDKEKDNSDDDDDDDGENIKLEKLESTRDVDAAPVDEGDANTSEKEQTNVHQADSDDDDNDDDDNVDAMATEKENCPTEPPAQHEDREEDEDSDDMDADAMQQ